MDLHSTAELAKYAFETGLTE
ncbi:hypothetical protein VDIAB_220043 [Vibrio diabolicus]|nr:hypothetical protein VDIAB_220043 [Vibrio diabolicus]